MEQTKPTLTSKTVLTALGMAILNALVFFGVISTDFGLAHAYETGGVLAVANTLLALLIAYFRKTATAKLG
jgi:hypothetical protein